MSATPRHLVCTAARPKGAAPFDPVWRSETAVALAGRILADAAPDRLPILADALEDAGCGDPQVLRHLRECSDHRPHCWVLAAVLDRPPVAEPVKMTDAQVRREVERVTGRPVLEPGGGPDPGISRVWFWRLIPAAIAVVVALVSGILSRTHFKLAPQYVPPAQVNGR